MSESKKLIPRRRFKEFEKSKEFCQIEWQKLVERLTVMSSAHCLPRVEFEDIISGQGELNKDVFKKINDKKGIEFKKGDILFGKLRPYLKNWLYAGFDGIAVGDFWVFRPTFSNGEFIYALIQTNQYQIVANQSTGTKMPRSDWNIVSNTKFIVTTNKIEQTKIGEFFKKLDNLINTQQKKLEKAKTLKSAYLREIFPSEDEPKRRFIGSVGLWKQKEIIEIGKIFIGLVTTMTENYTNVGTLLIRNSDIKDNKFEFSDNPIYLKETFAQINASRRLHIGDVVTVHTGDVGTSAVITKKEENAIGFATINTRPNQNIITPEFLSVFLNSRKHKVYAKKMSTGDGRSNYNLKDFNQLIVDLPHIAEQTKIGNFFKLLDDKIALEQKKLAKLKNIKQAYLNEMFV
ncbi:restriction endonuclease subunit S [Gilliamella intestini]|uniref:Type I restriction enzyme, S subunit n=1 Tax=Gilliamella intestini TaxID=1798183 RepID=A0A1C3ZKZ1_9GAMM|nr:restriction endonuclease subunit S [Gilliamella intestini]SCB82998.1 type I restriction enzyme, S subunit [Gilliamella intestini]